MANFVDLPQDMIIEGLYAWICIDPRTNLEGIVSVKIGGSPNMQAATSSLDIAKRLGVEIKQIAKETGKKFKLVHFGKDQIIEEVG